MSLADQVTQCRTPFVVKHLESGVLSRLNNACDCAQAVERCPLRFVLTDELTRLCTSLAFSKGASSLEIADLLRVPATSLWVEWCTTPWERELAQHGFVGVLPGTGRGGRHGLLFRSSPDGRRGIARSFWSDNASQPLASSVEAFFDLDVSEDDEPEPPDGGSARVLRVVDPAGGGSDVLGRCFRFRYERSWQAYYDRASLATDERAALDRHSLGTIAGMIPLVLAFFMLLGSRGSLPRRAPSLARLHALRDRAGKPRALETVEVDCPLIPALSVTDATGRLGVRCGPRLHHVRGHWVRRGYQVFWRVPHVRGNARAGSVKTRTVIWNTEPQSPARRHRSGAQDARSPEI